MRHFRLLHAFVLLASAGWGASAEGDWLGTIEFGQQKLRLVFHIKSDAGRFTATLDSPDQGAKGIPVDGVRVDGSAVLLELSKLSASYKGTVSEDGQQIQGTFSQGADIPLTLRRLKPGELEASAPKRPQIPAKPYPYDEGEVQFDNRSAAGVRLAGTMTLPRGEGPFPAVALITGSGPQTRDEDVAGHPVFLVLADHLTRSGIAVLRYDDRGTGASTGAFGKATTADFASDAEAAMDFLRAHPKVDSKRVGLLGHSEGGVVAPIVAGRRSDIGFIVLMAPTAVNGRDVILAQKEAVFKANNITRDLLNDRALYDAVVAEKDEATLRELIRKTYPGIPDKGVEAQLSQLRSPWFKYFLAYDPAPALAKVKAPMLVLFGEKDLQVLPSQNEAPLRAAIEKGGNKRVRIDVMPGLNHLLQTAKTGSPTEYSGIEETMSPKALTLISEWIKQAVR